MPLNVDIIPILKEKDFEDQLINKLRASHGWGDVLMYPTEEALIKNWADIIFQNNKDDKHLNGVPLSNSEMAQVIQQVDNCKTPFERNKLINSPTGEVFIKRDNPKDPSNMGKNVYLRIFNRDAVKGGSTRYQIARQPKFKTAHPLASERRGDVMLLIDGMPVIHIELKRSGVDVSHAINQIKRYTVEGVFDRGIFSLVQIFVAMTPEKTIYFANTGDAEKFNPSFQFHWADFNNNEIRSWQMIAEQFLSIPIAHTMIGYYTIADETDNVLKVMRSYQYNAVNEILKKVATNVWDNHQHKGGFVWHTTGSGKTMTSFKAAELIAHSRTADKVVFVLDRIELSIQSFNNYKGFAGENASVQSADDVRDLVRLLKSSNKEEKLVVTSFQKMGLVNTSNNIAQSQIDEINGKRLVFIFDECHRSVFGETLLKIQKVFPNALMFGFTGTPIFEENAKEEKITTGVLFGDELHKYTIANAIPDGNVLGFDMYKVDTFKESEVRLEVAKNNIGFNDISEIQDDKEKLERYNYWMLDADMIKVESEAKKLYMTDTHHLAVVQHIVSERMKLSQQGKFHAMLATKSIPECIAYYKIFKDMYPHYNMAAIFDESIDESDGSTIKSQSILEMLDDYNKRFGTNFTQSQYGTYKKDVAKRLAHKGAYKALIAKDHTKQIDILIVVTQMLTGYDSPWVNTLYVDKLMNYVDIIQAFSRTNRLFGKDKPFGIIKYYDRPNTMQRNIDEALQLYVDQPLYVHVDKLESHLEKINEAFEAIQKVFNAENIPDFSKLPKAPASRNKFADEFNKMTKLINAAKYQGFSWDELEYRFDHSDSYTTVKVALDEYTYRVLLQRYRELFERTSGGDGGDDDSEMYEIDAYLTETGAGTVDADYVNSQFTKYAKYLYTEGRDSEMARKAYEDLHSSFASLSQRDQATAMLVLHDLQSGDLRLRPGMTINDYIAEYQLCEVHRHIRLISEATGINNQKLQDLIELNPNEKNINEYGRFDSLMSTAKSALLPDFFKKVTGKEAPKKIVDKLVKKIIENFVLNVADREKIVYAYQNDSYDYSLDIPSPEVPKEKEETVEVVQPRIESNDLSEEEKRKNIRKLVMKDLRQSGVGNTEVAVNAFFDILTIHSDNTLDGVGIELYKATKELYGVKKVDFVNLHTDTALLYIKFEVYLKKLYFMLNGCHVPPKPGDTDVNLADAVKQFDCLRDLRYSINPKHQKLYEYLSNIYNCRNTEAGSGAHFSLLSTEDALKENARKVMTMYIYVTGMCYNDLCDKYPELKPETIHYEFPTESESTYSMAAEPDPKDTYSNE